MYRARLAYGGTRTSLLGKNEHGLVRDESLQVRRRFWSNKARTTQPKNLPFSGSHLGLLPPTKQPSTTQIPTTTPTIPKYPLPSSSTRVPGAHPIIQAKIAFISGPLEPDTTYFETYYLPLIDHAINEGHQFVLAASRGIDAEARAYLLSRVPASRLTIYLREMEGPRARTHLRAFERAGGRIVVEGRNHTQRDEALTRDSHYDILRYRTDSECRALYGKTYRRRISGTEKNDIRRKAGVGLVWTEPEASTMRTVAKVVEDSTNSRIV
ncbi:hypothetical protein BDZ94DRAFT_1233477 [Collybia nuda]|uniref:Uncharacterized protein n=1 Tax=Collybia nuda TaxID=64659 RepID=A0A9P5YFK2_9AGAR|nr:hypothetical protein BDZ94DRAFT_1233477 [Collybia nuda]